MTINSIRDRYKPISKNTKTLDQCDELNKLKKRGVHKSGTHGFTRSLITRHSYLMVWVPNCKITSENQHTFNGNTNNIEKIQEQALRFLYEDHHMKIC